MNAAPVCGVLDALGARYALIGAQAMAVRGYPRFTVDIDILTTDARVLERATWEPIAGEGCAIDPRRGDIDDPLAGVVHIQFADGSDFDVVLAKWQWEGSLIERSEVVKVLGVRIRVPRLSDLILLKLAAGGYLDLRDAAALLGVGDRDAIVREVDATVAEVRPDVQAVWSKLLAETRPV